MKNSILSYFLLLFLVTTLANCGNGEKLGNIGQALTDIASNTESSQVSKDGVKNSQGKESDDGKNDSEDDNDDESDESSELICHRPPGNPDGRQTVKRSSHPKHRYDTNGPCRS